MNGPSRRRFLKGSAIAIAGLAGCSSLSGHPPADCSDEELVHESDANLNQAASWPSYQYDSANTGHNPEASGPKDDVEVAWRYPACTEAESGAVVHDGRVSAGGLVVDGQTGRAVGGEWDSHASTPTFDNGRVYVGAHDLLALDATTGERDWTFETDSDSGGLATPAVEDGTVYTRGQFDDPTIYAVDASNGEEIWRFEPDSEGRFPLAVADETVYSIDETSTIYAINATSGEEQWRRTPSADIKRSTPVIGDGILYLGTGEGDLLALDADDGSNVWRRSLGTGSVGPVAIADGTLFLPGQEKSLIALTASDGHEEWRRSVSATLSGPPVVADDIVYVVAGQTLYTFDASNGDEGWQFETREVLFGDYERGWVNSGLAVVDDLVYVATAPGDLYALQAQ
ncbi:PQQ-binding-like beta-propeller repeat protein [Halococcoides cellulosivorans]|uniref:Pyrrolo-quinoline quinone n=1 Tax=Halococcoides cellulosivorans TaxID=1679096 RepID=A0A2R4X3R2_9EURY|nr:PQQ-binding-like beta-propeller repeat protein [Halococcoides cellulosivorans]AWB28428.1 Pyrrolo-quinoline quinone [Halococcoides cellulosivorans]